MKVHTSRLSLLDSHYPPRLILNPIYGELIITLMKTRYGLLKFAIQIPNQDKNRNLTKSTLQEPPSILKSLCHFQEDREIFLKEACFEHVRDYNGKNGWDLSVAGGVGFEPTTTSLGG